MPSNPEESSVDTFGETVVPATTESSKTSQPTAQMPPEAETNFLEDEGDVPATRVVDHGHDATPAPTPGIRSAALWDTVESSGEFQPGQLIFNRYVVQGKLGRGGMGTVWLVTHRELNADRALKMIVAGISYDTQARARFRREAQVMAKFSHPNAVTVHDARLTENDVAFIDMEYVRGQSLDRVIQRGHPMPLDWIARILEQLCEVLQVAHDHGIVHRDLKPANLMLLDGRAYGKEHLKVLDFGIAKILQEVEAEGGPATMTGVFMGTPPYASPEQADGKADTRSDVYALGVILYEFLTGFRPFSGPASRILVDTITTPPPPFSAMNPKVEYAPGIEALVMKCLAKKPEERPQSAREMAEAFLALMPRPASADDKTIPPKPESRLLGLKIAAAVVAILAFLWVLRSSDILRNTHFARPPTVLLPEGFVAAPKSEVDPSGRPVSLIPKGVASATDMRMRLIQGDTFLMGDGDAQHKEAVSDFAMSETEVTNGQMLAYFASAKISAPEDYEAAFQKLLKSGTLKEAAQHPAVGIPYAIAEGFAKWAGARLPTEAEWEYAARSRGEPNRAYVWDDPTKFVKGSNKANIDTTENLNTATLKVRSFPDDQTEQGIFDMAGNVREWCRKSQETSSQAPVRGASWNVFCSDYSNFAKQDLSISTMTTDLGFRVVADWPQSPVGGPK